MNHKIEQPDLSRLARVRGLVTEKLGRFVGPGNPLLRREVLSTMRLRSVKAVLIALPLAIAGLVIIVAADSSRNPGSSAEQGTVMLTVAIAAALYVVGLLGAVLGAQSVSSERQAKTLDLVLATGMSPWRIIAGKTMAVWVVMAVMVLACLPPLSICFIVGGISLSQMLLAVALPLIAGMIPVSLGICLGTGRGSAKLSVGASAALVGLIGPMIFVAAWTAIIAVIGVDDFRSHGPMAMPTGTEGFWSLLIGGVLMPAFFVIAPTWFFLALGVSALSGEATDRSRPLRRWFVVVAPMGGLLVGSISLLKEIDGQGAVGLISALALLLTFGVLALTAHRAPRVHDPGAAAKRFAPGPNNDAIFATIVAAISLLPAVLMPATGSRGHLIFAGAVVLGFVVLMAGSGVYFSSLFKSRRLARWALVGLAAVFSVGPMALWLFLEILEGHSGSGASEAARLFSPIGAMAEIARHRSNWCSCSSSSASVGVALWTVLGAVLWQIGAVRLRQKREIDGA